MLATFVLIAAPPPAWFDTTLAGYAMTYDARHGQAGVHDPRRGFFVVRTVECDGASLDLTLTRDRHVVADLGYAVPGFRPGALKLNTKSLPSLATGKGVRIGDTSQSLRHRLGAPTKTEPSGSRGQFKNYVYIWRDGRVHTQTYTFKANRLIEIHFSRGLPEEDLRED